MQVETEISKYFYSLSEGKKDVNLGRPVAKKAN